MTSQMRQRSDVDDPKPLQESSFDFELPEASTPLKISSAYLGPDNTSSLFISPIRKLSGLHLDDGRDIYNPGTGMVHESEDDGYDEAEQTIGDDLSDVEYKDDADVDADNEEDNLLHSAPVYLKNKKRYMDSSPLDLMVLTPATSMRVTSASIDTNASCSFKISFSDSTPCPNPPRKRLKLKESLPFGTPLTGSKRRNILNFSNYRKTSINEMKDIQTDLSHDCVHDEYDAEEFHECNDSMNKSPEKKTKADTQTSVLLSTPISQSTPANSRAPSPPTVEEFGQPVNGFRFVRRKDEVEADKETANIEKNTHTHTHTHTNVNINSSMNSSLNDTSMNWNEKDHSNSTNTTQITPQLNELKRQYILQQFKTPEMKKYSIIGELPVENAGLMDENDNNVHIADKRINDPYITGVGLKDESFEANRSYEKNDVSESKSGIAGKIRLKYLNSDFVPLLSVAREEELDKGTIIEKLKNGKPIMEFYEYILQRNESLLGFIRKDRVRWHPDKWVGKDNIDKDIIETLIQSLNGMVDELENA